MKWSARKKIGFALFAVALCVLAYFAADLPFFSYRDPLERASLSVSSDSGTALSFTYGNDAITLRTAEGQTVSLYALTIDGITALEAEAGTAQPLSALDLGSFAAVADAVQADTDGDGMEETLIAAAKTDMEYTLEYAATANVFLDSAIPLEAAFYDREYFMLYFQAQPLINADVTAVLSDGTAVDFTTDDSGATRALTLNQVRNGVTFVYRPSTTETYTLAYQPEDNTLFTLRYLMAMLPFMLILLVAAAAVALDVLMRRRVYRRAGMPEGKTRISARDFGRKRFRFSFFTVRWLVMAGSFALLVFGGRMIGTSLSSAQLPVFACPYNLDQAVGASCYSFSHLDVLFASSLSEILWFAGSFILSGLLFGRLLCGFVCPLGFVQDIAYEARQALHVEGISMNERLYAVLRLVKWVMLLIFLGVGFIGGSFCDFCPAMALSPAFAGFKLSLYLGGFIMVIVLVSGFFKRRCFCNVCPMGYILGLFHKISLFQLKKDSVACTECGACYEACPMGIKTIFTDREHEKVTTADCLMCGECVRRCPEDHALAITFCGKKVCDASRMRFMDDYARPRKKSGKAKRQ